MFGYFWYGICLPHTEHMSWDGYITSILESWESTDYIIDDIFIAYRYVVCMYDLYNVHVFLQMYLQKLILA